MFSDWWRRDGAEATPEIFSFTDFSPSGVTFLRHESIGAAIVSSSTITILLQHNKVLLDEGLFKKELMGPLTILLHLRHYHYLYCSFPFCRYFPVVPEQLLGRRHGLHYSF